MMTPFGKRLLAGLLLLVTTLTSSAQEASVQVDGKDVQFSSSPRVIDGRLVVPLREVIEALDGTVEFHPSSGSFRAVQGNHVIQIVLGGQTAVVNGKPVFLPGVKKSRDGVMVPLRFLADSLGGVMTWDPKKRVAGLWSDAPQQQKVDDTPESPETQPSLQPSSPTHIPLPPPHEMGSWTVTPAPGATVQERRPQFTASFPEAIDPASLQFVLDGEILTRSVQLTSFSMLYRPAKELAPGRHEVLIKATGARSNRSHRHSWTFQVIHR